MIEYMLPAIAGASVLFTFAFAIPWYGGWAKPTLIGMAWGMLFVAFVFFLREPYQ